MIILPRTYATVPDFSYFAVGISLSCKRGMILGKEELIDFKKWGG